MNTLARLISLTLLAALMVACAQEPPVPDEPAAAAAESALHVRTWLEIEDVRELDSAVEVRHFRIPSGRFAFLSDDGEDQLLAMSAPVDLSFDVRSGQLRVAGPSVTLPEAGTWRVRLHLYPERTVNGDARSVIISGTWDPERAAGEPSPLPWRPNEKSHNARSFSWTSSATATVDLEAFQLDEDANGLIVSMPMEDWIVAVLEPSLRQRFDSLDESLPHPDDLPEHDVDTEEVPGTLLEDDGAGLGRLLERISATFLTTAR
ncbi:MAG: hypothetical protein EA398_16975 [Deltaproteobacteria bacterium]|nr:MAG: hypothetical protein EA398_16975 [Deltaproteobacteria bacterium]